MFKIEDTTCRRFSSTRPVFRNTQPRPHPWTPRPRFGSRSRLFSLYFLTALATLLGTLPAHAGNGTRENPRTVLFFGDSLTAAYRIDPDAAYPALIEEKMRAEGFDYRSLNAGVSGETTAGGLRRIDWVLRREIDVFVLALGGNDILRGFAPEEAKSNLRGILKKVRERYPDTVMILAGMQTPRNMGADYAEAFAAIYPALAEEFDIPLIPFLLEGMAADPAYNLDDLIHPNERGHQVIAKNVWQHLRPQLTE